MLKVLQARLQQSMNWELPDIQAALRKGRGTRDLIANIHWITEKQRKFQKNIYLCFIDYTKAFDCVDHNKLWKILKKMGIPDHLTSLLRNLYVGQEETARTRPGTGSKLGKEYVKAVYCHLAYLTYMQNQDCWEKYRQPQIRRWHHSNGRKWRGTKELHDEGKRGAWKRWL